MPKKSDSIRWTLRKAVTEFGVNRETIEKKLSAVGVVAGKDDCYSTREIYEALSGDTELRRERLRKIREDADGRALSNAEMKRWLVDKPDLLGRFQAVFSEMKQRILNCSMKEHEKNQLLNAIADLETTGRPSASI